MGWEEWEGGVGEQEDGLRHRLMKRTVQLDVDKRRMNGRGKRLDMSRD